MRRVQHSDLTFLLGLAALPVACIDDDRDEKRRELLQEVLDVCAPYAERYADCAASAPNGPDPVAQYEYYVGACIVCDIQCDVQHSLRGGTGGLVCVLERASMRIDRRCVRGIEEQRSGCVRDVRGLRRPKSGAQS